MFQECCQFFSFLEPGLFSRQEGLSRFLQPSLHKEWSCALLLFNPLTTCISFSITPLLSIFSLVCLFLHLQLFCVFIGAFYSSFLTCPNHHTFCSLKNSFIFSMPIILRIASLPMPSLGVFPQIIIPFSFNSCNFFFSRIGLPRTYYYLVPNSQKPSLG